MLNDDIKGTKDLIEFQVKRGKPAYFGVPFSTYQKVYSQTNENLAGYINAPYFEGKSKALSVLASGDHVFNMVQNGVTDIDTFDSNTLTKYYSLGLKKAAILKYSYKEYLAFLKTILNEKTSNEEIEKIFKALLPYMDQQQQDYWQEILDFNKSIQQKEETDINLFRMLLLNMTDNDLRNGYLASEDNYNQLKTKLKKANITFRCCDCFDIPTLFPDKYDAILLSNIPDYFYKRLGKGWTHQDILPFKEQLKEHLTDDGSLYFSYMYLYEMVNSQKPITKRIEVSCTTPEDFDDASVITFPHIDGERECKNVNDAVILVKKK